jgi:hypothetical protein
VTSKPGTKKGLRRHPYVFSEQPRYQSIAVSRFQARSFVSRKLFRLRRPFRSRKHCLARRSQRRRARILAYCCSDSADQGRRCVDGNEGAGSSCADRNAPSGISAPAADTTCKRYPVGRTARRAMGQAHFCSADSAKMSQSPAGRTGRQVPTAVISYRQASYQEHPTKKHRAGAVGYKADRPGATRLEPRRRCR